MQKRTAQMLREAAQKVALMFSNKDRDGNTGGETFSVQSITVLSEATAAVIFDKQPTGKRAVAWFYFVNSRRMPRWEYFFVTYQHLAGLEHVAQLLHDVEQFNFERNFKGES